MVIERAVRRDDDGSQIEEGKQSLSAVHKWHYVVLINLKLDGNSIEW
jgi:hypothetical protein